MPGIIQVEIKFCKPAVCSLNGCKEIVVICVVVSLKFHNSRVDRRRNGKYLIVMGKVSILIDTFWDR